MSDALRERLDRIAGISLRAPRGEYLVTGLSFGEAKLRRNTSTGRWEALILQLTPAAAADVEKAGGSRDVTVIYPLEHWLAQGATFDGEVDVVAAGLHALLVDDGLLSRPELLTSAASIDPPPDPLAAASLEALRSRLSRATRRTVRCPVCADRRSTLDPRFSQRNSQYSEQTELLRMLGIILPGRVQSMRDEPAPECPHVAMRGLALQRLFEEHPELGFEAALLLVPVTVSDPPRFVLSPMAMKPMLEEWLMLDARDDDDDYDEFMDEPRRVVVPRAAPGDSTLTPGQRGALAFATQSWEAVGPLPGYLPPANDASGEMPVMASEPISPDVALLWPEGVAKPAPKLPPPPPPRKPAAKKRAKAPTASPTASPTPSPTPGQELMTSELRALGYTEAKVKKLLKDGTLERAGYGWFRWKG